MYEIKKLNLKNNQKVLDIGCGWGSLAIDIAKNAKCEVTGITLSENQLNYCNKKAKEMNDEYLAWKEKRDIFRFNAWKQFDPYSKLSK